MTYNGFSAEALQENKQNFQNSFNQIADRRGWAPETLNKLSMSVTDESIDLDVPNELWDFVLKLEYGSLTQAPAAAVREFSDVVDRAIADVLETRGINALLKAGMF